MQRLSMLNPDTALMPVQVWIIDLSAVYLTFDINLNFGINQVINEAGRYSVQQFSGGLYDVQDNLRLLVPSLNIGIIFPLTKPARSKVVCEY